MDILIMNTLYFEEEVVIPEEVVDAKFSKKELDLAVQLVNSLKIKFKPEEYIDEYQKRVQDALKAKETGKKVKVPKAHNTKNIKDLMTALELSLKNVS